MLLGTAADDAHCLRMRLFLHLISYTVCGALCDPCDSPRKDSCSTGGLMTLMSTAMTSTRLSVRTRSQAERNTEVRCCTSRSGADTGELSLIGWR